MRCRSGRPPACPTPAPPRRPDADGGEVAGDARLRPRHARHLARGRRRPARPIAATPGSGTVLAVFQPAEETAQGAQAMIDDGLFDRFPKPEVILGQHVMPAPAGQIGYRPGTTQAAADSLEVRLFGRGAHGSMPESSVDPVVMAAATVLRLQTIVSREIAATPGRRRHRRRAAGRHQGQRHPRRGAAEDQRPHLRRGRPPPRPRRHRADRQRRGDRLRRAQAARDHHHRALPAHRQRPRRAPQRVAAALRGHFGDDRVHELAAPVSASEDFGSFGTEWGVPSVFWYVGGTDPDAYRAAEQAGRVAQDIPTNHNPAFAPVIHPTLETGVAGHHHRRARRTGRLTSHASTTSAFVTATAPLVRGAAHARSAGHGGSLERPLECVDLQVPVEPLLVDEERWRAVDAAVDAALEVLHDVSQMGIAGELRRRTARGPVRCAARACAAAPARERGCAHRSGRASPRSAPGRPPPRPPRRHAARADGRPRSGSAGRRPSTSRRTACTARPDPTPH